jgi:hypothetical protein
MTRIDPTRWSELSPLLDEVLELPSDERGAWLEVLRTTRRQTAAELEMLLAELQSLDAVGFLQGEAAHALSESSLVGQTIGAYTLESRIGHGGMGSVWLAHRTDGRLDSKVAIKLLNIALLGRGVEERLRREGRLLSKLTHPEHRPHSGCRSRRHRAALPGVGTCAGPRDRRLLR